MYSRMNGATTKAIALALTTFVVSATADAQRSPNERTGLMLGVHSVGAQGITLAGEDFDEPYQLNAGFGAGVTLGYAVNRTFSSFVSFDVAKQSANSEESNQGTFGLGHLEFGVRANLPLGLAKTVPYVTGSVGRRGLAAKATNLDTGDSFDIGFHGRIYGVGAGVEHSISPSLSLDGGVQLAFGKFDHVTDDGEESDIALNSTKSIRVRLGLTWRP
jgi:Outer membrane protein beta-barrel domain